MSSSNSPDIPLQPLHSGLQSHSMQPSLPLQPRNSEEDPDAITSSLRPQPDTPTAPPEVPPLTLDEVLNHLVDILPRMDETVDRTKASQQVQSDAWMAETHLKSLRAKFAKSKIDDVVSHEKGRVEAVRILLGRLAWGVADDTTGICVEMHCPNDETFNAPEIEDRMHAHGFWPPRESEITVLKMITKPLHPEDEDYLNATTPIPKKSFFRKAQPPPPPEPREDPSPLKQFLADLESLRKELKPVGFDQRSVMPRAWREGAEREKKMTEERRRKAGVIVERGTGAEAGSSSDR